MPCCSRPSYILWSVRPHRFSPSSSHAEAKVKAVLFTLTLVLFVTACGRDRADCPTCRHRGDRRDQRTADDSAAAGDRVGGPGHRRPDLRAVGGVGAGPGSDRPSGVSPGAGGELGANGFGDLAIPPSARGPLAGRPAGHVGGCAVLLPGLQRHRDQMRSRSPIWPAESRWSRRIRRRS